MAQVAKYIELANQLRRDILSGLYGSEGGLPGINELVKRSGLAANTVYRALSMLEGECLLIQRDQTYFVNRISVSLSSYVPPHYLLMQSQGKTSFAVNIIPAEVVPLPDEIASRIPMTVGIPVTHRLRILGETEGEQKKPTWLVEYWYLIPLSEEQRQRMRDNPHLHILPEASPVNLYRFDQISARQPTAEEAQYLQIEQMTPVLDFRSIVRDRGGHPLLYQQLVLLGTTLTYSYDFENKPAQ